MADKRVAEQEKQLRTSCDNKTETLKKTLNEKCSREADDLVKELGQRHQNALAEQTENMTEE
jgi:gas vesicle protein